MILEKFAATLIVFVWVSNSLADNHRSGRSNNEYILHRCIATAELIRKHWNAEVLGVGSRRNVGLSQLQIQRRSPDSMATTLSRVYPSEIARQTNSARRYVIYTKSRDNAHARRIAGKHLADTPLKTLHIDVPQDRPSAFKKKNLLPELPRNMSGRKIDSLPHVIIIKPAT